jgi:hypothetical protein
VTKILLIDGHPGEGMRNGLAGMGGINLDAAEALDRSGKLRYEDGCPAGGYDPAERLVVMDEEGIDVALLSSAGDVSMSMKAARRQHQERNRIVH